MKLKIGDFSKMTKVTVKALRYYEDICILMPIEVDKWTGYRYYDTEQLETVCRIQYYKRLGFSLDEIKTMLAGIEPELIEQKLAGSRELLSELNWRITELENFEKHLTGGLFMQDITTKALPQMIAASYRTTIKSYSELNDLFPDIICPELQRLGSRFASPYCFNVYHDGEYRETDIDVEVIQHVTEKLKDSEIIKFKILPEIHSAVCVKHKGRYDNLPQSYAKAFAYIEKNGLEAAGFPRESYIYGKWNQPDAQEWLTEIQVPVKKI